MIIRNYIASKFWPPFFFGLGTFALLAFLADVFDHLNVIVKNDAAFQAVVKYFSLSVPFWTLTVVPIASLLAVLFVISDMLSSGEWLAASASGLRPAQLVAPIMACCALTALANFVLQETVSPSLHKNSEAVYETEIRGGGWRDEVKQNVVLKAGKDVFLSAWVFNRALGTFDRAVMSVQKDGRAVRQTDAKRGAWDKRIGRWVFYDGVEREFSADGSVSEKPFSTLVSGIAVQPSAFNVEKTQAEDLNIRELKERIKNLRKTGSPARRERVFVHAKLAAPFSQLILCLLAVPFALAAKKAGKLIHFGAAICLAFFYWWAASVFQAAGEAGLLSPAISAWTPPAIFAAITAWSLKKTGI